MRKRTLIVVLLICALLVSLMSGCGANTDKYVENVIGDRVPEADLNNNDPDVVRVVRCKDCDRSQVDFDKHGEVTFRCRLYDPWIVYVRSDGLGYCSNGIKA